MKMTGTKSSPAITNNALIFENTILATDMPAIKITPVDMRISEGVRSTLDLAVPKTTPASIRLGAPAIETIWTVTPKGSTEICGEIDHLIKKL